MCWNSGIIVTRICSPNTSLLLISSFFVLHLCDLIGHTHTRMMLRKFLASNHTFTAVTLEVESFDSNGMLYPFCLKQLKFYLPKMIYSFLFIFECAQTILWTAKMKQVYDKHSVWLTFCNKFKSSSHTRHTLPQKDQSPIKDHPKNRKKNCFA